VLGLDFGGTKIAAAVADLEGNRLAERITGTEPVRGVLWNFNQGVHLARELIRAAGAGTKLLAIGACTFGIPMQEGILLAPTIPGWEGLALARELTNALQCSAVRVETDVKAAAAAEAGSGALVGADPGIYLNLGTGLAIGIVCSGKVVRGNTGAAGEIGYNLRHVRDLDDDPKTRIRLEDVVSGMALGTTASRETGSSLTAAHVFAADAADQALIAAREAFVRELVFETVNLAITLNPARIAVGGGILRSWSQIEPQLRLALDTFVPFPPELVPGTYPYDAPLVGAISLGMQAAHCAGLPLHGSVSSFSTRGVPDSDSSVMGHGGEV